MQEQHIDTTTNVAVLSVGNAVECAGHLPSCFVHNQTVKYQHPARGELPVAHKQLLNQVKVKEPSSVTRNECPPLLLGDFLLLLATADSLL
eukprot:199403-Amphidinium_carterae.2